MVVVLVLIEEISCLMAGKIKKNMKFGKYDLEGNLNPRIRLIDAFKNLIDFDPKIEDGLTDIEEKSKRLFHNEWKKLQRYHQLREEAFTILKNHQKQEFIGDITHSRTHNTIQEKI